MAKLKVFKHSNLVSEHTLLESKEYILGRAEESDIRLEGTAFSRQHLKLSFNSEFWQIEVISKFGIIIYKHTEVVQLDLKENSNFLCPPYSFEFETESRPQTITIDNKSVDNNFSRTQTKASKLQEEFFDEKTNPGISIGEAYLLITHPDSSTEDIHFNEDEFLFGRGSNCHKQLDDNRLSRKHCILYRKDQNYYLMDLNSSNATFLNSEKLEPNQEYDIKSGDKINIGDTQIVFQIRDPKFVQKTMNLPVLNNTNKSLSIPSSGELIVRPEEIHKYLQLREDGSLGLPAALKIPGPNFNKKKDQKNKIIRYASIGVIAVLAILFIGEDDKKINKNKMGPAMESSQLASKQTDPFDTLSPEQKLLIESSLNLAYEKYTQGEYELALGQLEKIHFLLPNGFKKDGKDSLEIANYAREAIERQKQKQQIEQSQQRDQEIKNMIEAKLSECERKILPGQSPQQARSCLGLVYEYDPENPRAAALLQRLQEYLNQQQNKAMLEQEKIRLQKVGEELYAKAQQLEKQRKYLDAQKAYLQHINSSYPDPSKLKDRSKANVQSLKRQISQKVQELNNLANAQCENKMYKECIIKLNEVLEVDPSVTQAKESLQKFSTILNNNMKAMYTESILHEAQGNINEATLIWKRIIEEDVPNGTYYQKAKSQVTKWGSEYISEEDQNAKTD